MSKRPSYLLENIVGALVITEDVSVKAPLRASQVDLPVSDGLQDFYYNHTGDYMDGYFIALWTNVALTFGSEMLYNWSQNHLSEDNLIRRFVEKIHDGHKLFNVVSGLVSSVVIVMWETQDHIRTPDIKDIPMGIAGTLTNMGLRYLSIRRYENREPQQQLSYETNSC